MAIKIGHASKDERGKFNSGAAGDQTKQEVYTRTWYNGGWNVVLRPKSANLAEKSAQACEKGCANNKIGYDQYQRNNLYKYAKEVKFDLSKITTACECDCSSFMHVCAIAGGANLTYGSNGYVTFNMVQAFVASGDYEKLTASKYLTSDKYLKRGDILVKESGHTAMVLENGSAVDTTTEAPTEAKKQPSAVETGYTLTQFIKDVQKATGAEVDGIAGKETLSKTVTVSATKNNRHAVVRPLQKRLNALGFDCGTVDGIAGKKFTTAVIAYQKANNCACDGEITSKHKTWQHLLEII